MAGMAMKQYRLRDTKENYWLGPQEKTLLYENKELTKVAVMVLNVRLGWSTKRTCVMSYNET
jgi:hypothetical protein